MRFRLASLLLAGVCVLGGTAARADLGGTSVTGAMLINGSGPNYFDPANGFVPAGPLNNAGTTVSISNTLVEFGYHDSANTITADFTGTVLTLTDISIGGAVPITYTFSDNAFIGLNAVEISDNFIGGATGGIAGNTLTVNTGNFLGSSGTFSASYDITSGIAAAPLPSAAWGGLALFGLMIGQQLVRRLRTA